MTAGLNKVFHEGITIKQIIIKMTKMIRVTIISIPAYFIFKLFFNVIEWRHAILFINEFIYERHEAQNSKSFQDTLTACASQIPALPTFLVTWLSSWQGSTLHITRASGKLRGHFQTLHETNNSKLKVCIGFSFSFLPS